MSNQKFKFIDLFAGIGGFRIAFESAGGECVFSSEINKFARHTYTANYHKETIHWKDAEKIDNHEELFGDIRKVDIEKDIPDFDILAAGFPCPTFSLAGVSKRNSLGRKHGFDDEEKGQLFFEIVKILKAKQPKGFLLENVKNLVNHNKGQTFEIIKNTLNDLGYDISFKVFDAAKLVPQHRERILIAGFRKDLQIDFDLSELVIKDRKPKLKDILEDKVDDKYFISEKLWDYLKAYKEKHRKRGNGFGFSIADKEGVTRTMSARYHKDGSEILIDEGRDTPRMLTEKEASKLFGFQEEYQKLYGEEFEIPVSKTQAYQQFGNSVCVPLVRIVAENMMQAFFQQSKSEMKEAVNL